MDGRLLQSFPRVAAGGGVRWAHRALVRRVTPFMVGADVPPGGVRVRCTRPRPGTAAIQRRQRPVRREHGHADDGATGTSL